MKPLAWFVAALVVGAIAIHYTVGAVSAKETPAPTPPQPPEPEPEPKPEIVFTGDDKGAENG